MIKTPLVILTMSCSSIFYLCIFYIVFCPPRTNLIFFCFYFMFQQLQLKLTLILDIVTKYSSISIEDVLFPYLSFTFFFSKVKFTSLISCRISGHSWGGGMLIQPQASCLEIGMGTQFIGSSSKIYFPICLHQRHNQIGDLYKNAYSSYLSQDRFRWHQYRVHHICKVANNILCTNFINFTKKRKLCRKIRNRLKQRKTQ